MGKKRSLKERKFIKHYLESGGDAAAAWLKANPRASKKHASVNGNRMLNKCSITMTEILDRLGLDDFVLVGKLYEGLNADKHVVVDGQIDYVADWTNRLRALDMTYKLRGAYPKLAPKKAEEKEDKPRKASFLKVYENNNGSDDKIQSKAN